MVTARRALELVERRAPLVLGGLVLASLVARLVLALRTEVPWIYADEFIYSELARSVAEGGRTSVRDVPVYLSAVVPVLDAPGYLLGGTAAAYDWIRVVNALVMSLAALPAYGLARLALSRGPSLAFAALVLAWPAFAYTGVVMTEPAFFPAVLLATWALARALVRPTWPRQALVALTVLLAVGVRLQAVALIPAVVLAGLAVAALGREGGTGWSAAGRRLRAHAPLLVAAVALPLLGVAAQLARGRPLRGLLGGYGDLQATLDLGELWSWSVWHVAVVALSVGVVPLALAAATWGRVARRREADTAPGIVTVVVLSVALVLTLQVSAFAIDYADRVQERNLFALEPLVVLVALVGLARTGFGRVVAAATAGVLALALLDLPVERLLQPPPLSDTFTLVSVLRTSAFTGITAPSLVILLAVLGVALTVALVLLPRPRALVALPLGLMAVLVVMNAQITPFLTGYSRDVADSVAPTPRDWIDRAAGGERVALLWSSDDDPKLVWNAEFWNEAVDDVLAVPGPLLPELGALRADIDPASGRLVPPPGGRLPDARLVVAPAPFDLVGTPVTSARSLLTGMTLWRLDGPLRLRMSTSGRYADGWTGPEVVVRRHGCRAGTFGLRLRTGPAPRRTVDLVSGGRERTVVIPPGVVRPVSLPARPDPGTDTCTLVLRTRETATGVELGNPVDARVLGVMADPPRFLPARATAAGP